MNWNNCRGAYPVYISLGSTCQTAYQLRRLGLRRSAGPLDWFTSYSAPHLCKLLDSRFADFWSWEQLRSIDVVQQHYVIQDTVYQIESFHDFPLPYRPADLYSSFKEKIDRRITRFLQLIKEQPVCFVRSGTSRQDAYRLEQTLSRMAHKKFKLLIVNLHDQPSKQLDYMDWGLQHTASVTIPAGRDWRGDSRSWDQIMSGFRLNR